jgi:hypothetical protein
MAGDLLEACQQSLVGPVQQLDPDIRGTTCSVQDVYSICKLRSLMASSLGVWLDFAVDGRSRIASNSAVNSLARHPLFFAAFTFAVFDSCKRRLGAASDSDSTIQVNIKVNINRDARVY